MRKCPDSPWANKSRQTDQPNLYIDGNMDRKIEKRNGNMETRKERAGTKRGKLDRD